MYPLSKHLKYKIIEIVVHKFPDGEINLSLKPSLNYDKKRFFIQNFYPQVNEKIIESILIFNKNKIKNLNLIAPYMPYSRNENFSIILDILLNYFNKIITIDIHSTNLINEKIINIGTEKIFADKIENLYKNGIYKNIALISPDNGSLLRIIKLHQELKLREIKSCYYSGIKTRTKDGKVIINLTLPKNIAEYECLIIDDIIDSGRTIFKTQKILESKQVKFIDIFVTHPICSELNNPLNTINKTDSQSSFYQNLMKFNQVYFANTIEINFKHPKIKIIPIESLIIDFISNNKDI